MSEKQKQLFLSVAGYPYKGKETIGMACYGYKGNENEGFFVTDRPDNKKCKTTPWQFTFKFDTQTGYLFCVLDHRMTNNQTYGWSYDGTPLGRELVEQVYKTHY
ncbi:MAG: hypothetical protein GKR89_05420 [Candidatus Latescibacteria bacterium]|nr:hypothetical protein [Candidatus Latescibacterota bacterium]